MRIMVVRPGPNFSVQDVCRGWVRAFRQLGHDVADVNLDDRLTYYEKAEKALAVRDGDEKFAAVCGFGAHTIKGDLFDFQPDLLFVVSGFYLPPEFYPHVRQRGIRVALLCTESPYEDDRQLQRAPLVDRILLNDPTNLDRFREQNPAADYYPHAYDPDIHRPGPVEHPDHRSDFVFVGTGYPSRIAFFEQVDWSGIDAAFGGNWQLLEDGSPLAKFLVHDKDHCTENTDAVLLYRATKVAANLYRKETTDGGTADGWAMGPRELELAACGTFFLREPRGESDGLLGMLPTFGSPAEFESLLRHYLAEPGERGRLATEAMRAVEDRTFVNNARRLLASL